MKSGLVEWFGLGLDWKPSSQEGGGEALRLKLKGLEWEVKAREVLVKREAQQLEFSKESRDEYPPGGATVLRVSVVLRLVQAVHECRKLGLYPKSDAPPGGFSLAARRYQRHSDVGGNDEGMSLGKMDWEFRVCGHWYSAWRHGSVRQAIETSTEVPAVWGAWRQGSAPPGGVWNPVALEVRWRLAVRREPPGGLNLFRQAVLVDAVPCVGRFMDGVTCDDMSGAAHIKLLSRGDTSGEVRRAGLRAGRFVEAGPRAGSSPFLFVCGDDRVIRYTGADVDTGGAEDAQMAE
ncbi:hypothetical protein DEO72_LG5g2382 [Vigna unguiculata]|uniref:Uncharacterized protein n=1 Tax=Vigna unguiculata TaxID=3917 RepID=A0A4D6LZA4_VIGUN|nr:hypothetical protein DEO72_LG5g2382 [Vigna unguiculata]